MELKFIGNGSGFSKTNNNAFFYLDNNLYLIDCSLLNMNRIRELFDFETIKKIYIIVTHMHCDHVSGIPWLCDYLYHIYNKEINIIVPSSMINDIKSLNELCGVQENQYNIIDAKNISFIKSIILTKHSSSLKSGCYGYLFNLNNKDILFTGDTANLDAFSEYINDCDELYVDVSYNNLKVHVSFNSFINNLPQAKNIYLMHLDEEEKIRKEIKGLNNVSIAEIYKG